MKNRNAPHECAPTIEELNNIKSALLTNKNRTPEEQKCFEAVSLQLENYNMYYKKLAEE